ncbi:hypothetical protein Tco_0809265 [Tanacetum coccineum]
MEYNPSNLVFTEWLALKFYNHLEMDWYTKNALWVYWMRGDNEEEVEQHKEGRCDLCDDPTKEPPVCKIRRHDEGRKRGARLSSKYFVGCLVEHFGLVTEEGLQGLIVVVGELQMVGIDELVRLRICKRFGDTLAWVASGLERQQADPVPVQAPEPPPAAAQSRTMPQKMAIVEKEVHGIRESLDEQCEVVDTMTIDFSKRMVRRRTDDANTSAAPHTADQPDP